MFQEDDINLEDSLLSLTNSDVEDDILINRIEFLTNENDMLIEKIQHIEEKYNKLKIYSKWFLFTSITSTLLYIIKQRKIN